MRLGEGRAMVRHMGLCRKHDSIVFLAFRRVSWAVSAAFDPVTFGLVPLLLLGVAAFAVDLPAASSVDPIRVLKAE